MLRKLPSGDYINLAMICRMSYYAGMETLLIAFADGDKREYRGEDAREILRIVEDDGEQAAIERVNEDRMRRIWGPGGPKMEESKPHLGGLTPAFGEKRPRRGRGKRGEL